MTEKFNRIRVRKFERKILSSEHGWWRFIYYYVIPRGYKFVQMNIQKSSSFALKLRYDKR